jgi:predicted RNase H-like nuclease (RuvC/YqgF family)
MTAKGEMIPQTVENLQEIMEKDAEEMEKMGLYIIELEKQNHSLRNKLSKLRRRICSLAEKV